jgi:hypothetical protein
MTYDDGLAPFRAYMADCADPVNLAGPDEAEAYRYELERPGDFIAKLTTGVASTHLEDDLDKSVKKAEFTNPMNFLPGTVGYQKRIVMNRIVEQDGFRWAYGIDDQGRTVTSRFLGAVED